MSWIVYPESEAAFTTKKLIVFFGVFIDTQKIKNPDSLIQWVGKSKCKLTQEFNPS